MASLLPQVFISYRHESEEHAAAVRRLGERLKTDKIPVALDQFYLDEHHAGPDTGGWPTWCEDCANQSACVLIVASPGWFAAYEGKAPPGEGLGAATEAALFRQELWDNKGHNERIRLAYLKDIAKDEVPPRLRAWEPFRLFTSDKEQDRMIKWIKSRLLAAKDEKAILPEESPPRGAAATVRYIPNPYPGLAAFKPEQHEFFFGRDEDTARVVEKLTKTRFVSVVGRSGTGKSSLVAAGVEPALREKHPALAYLRFKPQANPFRQFAEALDRALPEERLELGTPRAERIQKTLEGNPSQVIEEYLGKLPSPILLFADQFEELFTQTPPQLAESFRRVIDALRQRDTLYLTLTLRSEFMYRLSEWLGGERFDASLVSLDPIEQEDRLRAIIVSPAEKCGVPVQPRLASALMTAAGKARGALPLIALTLARLFEQRDPEQGLTLAAYECMGGLEKVVHSAAAEIDRAIQGDAALGAAIRRLFAELATVIDDLPTRRTAKVGSLRADPHISILIEALRGQGFLTDPDELHIELAHEALFIHWPLLNEWCRQYSDKLALRRQAEQAAREWQRARELDDTAETARLRRSDALRWTWERQRPALEALLALNDKAAKADSEYTDPGIHAWRALENENTLAEPLRSFLHPEPLRLLQELETYDTPHHRREEIGLRLNQMCDPRPGVGLDESGLPDILWVDINEVDEVTLANEPQTFPVAPFRIAKYPVTWAQYRAFLEAEDGYRNKEWWEGREQETLPGIELWGFANYPALNVTWHDAVAFCCWLSHKRGLSGNAVIRLPTECEWQWVAQAGTENRKYPWSDEWFPMRVNCNCSESGIGRTTAVGMYPLGAPPLGVMDLAGNVLEWCLNEYNQPKNVQIGGMEYRAVRGGSWETGLIGCHTADRYSQFPVSRLNSFGFRVCCSASIE